MGISSTRRDHAESKERESKRARSEERKHLNPKRAEESTQESSSNDILHNMSYNYMQTQFVTYTRKTTTIWQMQFMSGK